MQHFRKKIRSIAEDSSFFNDTTLKRDNIILLASIFILMFVFPLFDNKTLRDWTFDILISVIIVFCITSLKFKKEKFINLSYWGLISFSLVWIHHFLNADLTKLISFTGLILFLVYITYSMIKHVAFSKSVNNVMLLNAINSYLLIGVIGAFLFISVDVSYSYFASAEQTLNFNNIVDPAFQDYIYYSFVTLTTLGFGDITPTIPITKALTTALSLIGQLYLTILVAMLVGKYSSQMKD